MEFDPKVSELVKKAKGIVHISLGIDSLESGAVAQGSTNAWRLEQALAYKSDGCPVQVRIVADVTMPPTDFHTEVFQKMGGSKFVLLTPTHYISKAHFEKTRQDITWDDAKSTGLFVYGKGDLRPAKFDAGWKPFKERCGTSYPGGKETEHCNNCGLGKFPEDKKTWKAKLSKLGWK